MQVRHRDGAETRRRGRLRYTGSALLILVYDFRKIKRLSPGVFHRDAFALFSIGACSNVLAPSPFAALSIFRHLRKQWHARNNTYEAIVSVIITLYEKR